MDKNYLHYQYSAIYRIIKQFKDSERHKEPIKSDNLDSV